jgi:L-lactate dehydrogenase (cytochrome)
VLIASAVLSIPITSVNLEHSELPASPSLIFIMSHIKEPPKLLSGLEVAKHATRESCWVIISGKAYDVTSFLDEHPGGANIILQYAGKDATEEYDPVHPEGTIEKTLLPDQHLGPVDMSTVASNGEPQKVRDLAASERVPLSLIMSLQDMETAASKVLSRRAWTFYHSAADSLSSLEANLNDWNKISFRPRIMRNVARVSMSRKVMGQMLSLPIFVAPAARARLAHDDGEHCIVRGIARADMGYCTSNVASIGHEDLMKTLEEEGKGGTLFFQLYVPRDKQKAKDIIRMARELGYKALVVTVDSAVIGKREEDERYSAELAYQEGMGQEVVPRTADDRPTLGKDLPILRGAHSSTLDWDDLKWIREEWGNSGPVLLKGIQTAEDAKMAYQMGVDGIYLSNHGGRQADHAPSSIRTLLEIRRFCPEIMKAGMEIILDGGCRRGADVLKALALGASAVGFGRPFLYACVYGTEGVEKTIQSKGIPRETEESLTSVVISEEIETTMRLIGVTGLDQLTPHYVNTTILEQELPPTLGPQEWFKGPLKSKL